MSALSPNNSVRTMQQVRLSKSVVHAPHYQQGNTLKQNIRTNLSPGLSQKVISQKNVPSTIKQSSDMLEVLVGESDAAEDDFVLNSGASSKKLVVTLSY